MDPKYSVLRRLHRINALFLCCRSHYVLSPGSSNILDRFKVKLQFYNDLKVDAIEIIAHNIELDHKAQNTST